MPLTIALMDGALVALQRVPRQTLQAMAQRTNNPHAGRHDIVGVTVAHLTVNQQALSYHREAVAPAGERFRFTGGTLRLKLDQTIYLLSTLNATELEVWHEHEALHVADNSQVFRTTLEPALRGDTTLFRPLFEQQQWFPIDVFTTIEVGITQAVDGFRGRGAAEPGPAQLYTGKAYSIVRHPLYLGFSLILAFLPAHTRNSFVSTIMIVAYFYAGTFFEEARLVRTFGQEYRDYQKAVPRFLPIRFFRR